MTDLVALDHLAERAPAVRTPRARGAVASWVLGRFVPVAPTSGYRIFLRGHDAPATEAGASGLLDELRSR